MKNLSIILISFLVFMSCTKDQEDVMTVEDVTVEFNCKSVVQSVEGYFPTRSATVDAVHEFPEKYTAYFVAAETVGMYSKGQLIKSFQVNQNANTIIVPKIKYDVYVTNYEQEGSWYTWTNAEDQLPQGSEILYLYGKNTIDYSKVLTGGVELQNSYAAVMVLDNEWVTGIPYHYDSNKNYFKSGDWYVLYIRNKTSNSKVPVTIPNWNSPDVIINKSIESNKIYKFIINPEVESTDSEDNFTVDVTEFTETVEDTVNPFD